MPSSRTPEGEPVRCPTCGAESRVDVSSPPGDTVCPVCGVHLWIDSSLDKIQTAKSAIGNFVLELTLRVTNQDFTESSCHYLLSGLQYSLAAHGALLWSTGKGFLPLLPRKPQLRYYVGQLDSPVLAADVFSTKSEIQRYAKVEGKSCLLLGVPLFHNGRVFGAIEVVQRDERSKVLCKGYMRFLSHVAKIAAPIASSW